MMAAQHLTPSWDFTALTAGLCELAQTPALSVSGLALDSRKVAPGQVFFACAGAQRHGKTFIDEAVARGAAVVLWEADSAQYETRRGVPVLGVPGLRDVIGRIAERFYGSPTQEQFVVGVTGTNGKTSISQFIAQGFHSEGPCGVIGTLGNGLFGNLAAGTHTTPDAVTLHALLDDLRQSGARRVVMEVSSHGLEQGRVAGVAFDVAVFSNLTHEHLDYHGGMVAYGRAKQRLFEIEGLKYAVINVDDAFGRELVKKVPTGVQIVTYGLNQQLQPVLMGKELRLDHKGLRLQVESPWGRGELRAPLLGAFNAANLLAALGVLLVSDIALQDALERLAHVRPVPGRMERFGGETQPLVVVDYAHTPDALQQVLAALRAHTGGELICVFGCGGDRDKTKRPLMARAAERLADRVIVTDDNPRTESPAAIIADILAGFGRGARVEVIGNRAQAIAQAVASAAPADVVLVAGKGHEDYQQIGERRLPFSDTAEVRQALRARGGLL